MASILNDTMSAAKDVIDSARENVEPVVSNVKEGAEHAVATTRTTFFDAVKAATGLISTLRSLDGDDALGWMGLSRKRSPLYTIALVAGGVAVGAGVGMLLAPTSGAKLRELIFDRMRGLGEQAKPALEPVVNNVKQAEQKVEDMAGKAVDAVKQVPTMVQDKVTAGTETIKGVVMHQVGALADVAEDMTDDTRKGNDTANTAGTNANNTTKRTSTNNVAGNNTTHNHRS